MLEEESRCIKDRDNNMKLEREVGGTRPGRL